MTELTPEKRAELRAKAEAATPGPLRVTLGARIHEERTISREDDHIDIIACHVPPNDADFMAAFDRETCLALLDAAEERDRLREQLRQAVDVVRFMLQANQYPEDNLKDECQWHARHRNDCAECAAAAWLAANTTKEGK